MSLILWTMGLFWGGLVAVRPLNVFWVCAFQGLVASFGGRDGGPGRVGGFFSCWLAAPGFFPVPAFLFGKAVRMRLAPGSMT